MPDEAAEQLHAMLQKYPPLPSIKTQPGHIDHRHDVFGRCEGINERLPGEKETRPRARSEAMARR